MENNNVKLALTGSEAKKLVSKELEGTRNESLLLGSKNKGINIFQDE